MSYNGPTSVHIKLRYKKKRYKISIRYVQCWIKNIRLYLHVTTDVSMDG